MNKKGLEDSLPTWIVTLFVLSFFVLIYFGGVFVMFGDKTIFGDGEVVVESGNNLIVVESFKDFLESEVEFGGSEVLVKDLVDLEGGLKEFKKLGSEFVEELDEKKVWLRVYDFVEDVEVSFDGKYKDYEVSRSVSVREGRGSWSPMANSKKEVFCDFKNSDGFLFFGFSLNKKIVLCWENE
ncbi:hypothetical protein HOE04_05560 [archaeon]|jgi:hypothetical protein|nr:hypothetical protein [archaeon]